MAQKIRTARKKTGEAGRGGPEVRSDLRVVVELTEKGGVQLELTSRVEPYYGDSIREQIRSVAADLGVEHARIEVNDQGALPFVIAARLEAAIRQAGGGEHRDARPQRMIEPAPASSKGRLRRSRLYLPGNEPKFAVSAGLHGPDAVILDLEDSVHPDSKDAARLVVRNALRCVDFGNAERMVRINQLPLGLEDLEAIVPEEPDLLLIPKVEDASQVQEVDAAIARILDSSSRPLWLMPILESGLGIERAFDIAMASPRVCALTIGLEDYTADLGVVKTREGEETLYARRRVVNAAAAAGVQAIDSVYGDVQDMEGLRAWAERSRQMGFQGMGCVHPRQIQVVHEAFAPTESEIEKATQVMDAFRAAQAKGLGVVSLGSKMIDPPVVERARQLVEQAGALGLTPRTEEDKA